MGKTYASVLLLHFVCIIGIIVGTIAGSVCGVCWVNVLVTDYVYS